MPQKSLADKAVVSIKGRSEANLTGQLLLLQQLHAISNMSGIEVAGLLLGAIPILLEAVDLYKDGIRKSTTAFRKRRYIEKLTFALLLQKQKLEETVVSVLKASGCRDIWLMDDDPLGQLLKDEVQEQVLDYLGPKNNVAFNGALEQCNNIIKKIAGSMTGLVPSLKVCHLLNGLNGD